MRNPFRAWLLEQPIDNEALSLFEESFLCYQFGAYRAALIFSYLGLMRTIGYRLMTGAQPTKLPEKMWKKIQKQLRDDNTWESAAYDAAIRAKPETIFLLDDDIRKQLEYWRGRRNDSAHSRGNAISAPHVESLWLFIRSNLSKIVVNGGREGLMERFRRHFDPNYTSPGASFEDLVQEMPQAVRPQDYRDFLSDVLSLLDIEDSLAFSGDIGVAGGDLIDHIAKLNDNSLIEALLSLLRERDSLLVGSLLRRPNLVLQLSANPWIVRKLWRDLLPFSSITTPRSTRDRSLRVFSALLRNGLIPEVDQAEAMAYVVERLDDGEPAKSYPDNLLDELEPFGFFKAVYDHAFGYDPYWPKANILLILEYLWRCPLDSKIAERIVGFFSPQRSNPDEPEGTEYLERLQYHLSDRQDLVDEVVRLAQEQSISTVHFERAMENVV